MGSCSDLDSIEILNFIQNTNITVLEFFGLSQMNYYKASFLSILMLKFLNAELNSSAHIQT